MRPVDKGTNHPNYQPPDSLCFRGAQADAIRKVLGTHEPTVQACLEIWLKVVKTRSISPKPNDYDDWEAAADIIRPRIDSIYRMAALPLLDHLGAFCSYCETPIPGLLEVEHAVPKSEYPTFSVDWENFLIACGPCNTAKGSNPGRDTVEGWLPTSIMSESQCRREIREKHYLWPDLEPLSYQFFWPQLLYDHDGSGTWELVPKDAAFDPESSIRRVESATRTVLADFPAAGLSDVPVRVLLAPSYGRWGIRFHGDDRRWPAFCQRAFEMISLCGLNSTGNATSTYDRRVLNRTCAWFDVLAALKSLSAAKQSGDQRLFDTIWPVVGITAKGIGFFSVWVYVLSRHTDPSGVRLGQRFVQEFARSFPNTLSRNVP